MSGEKIATTFQKKMENFCNPTPKKGTTLTFSLKIYDDSCTLQNMCLTGSVIVQRFPSKH
jgi:hypothetical protein